MRKLLTVTAAAFIFAACTSDGMATKSSSADAGSATTYKMAKVDTAKLAAVLATQSDEAKSRFDARNPAETLEFFGIAPGMAVGEALPGGGWYSKILAPYLGEDGQLVGIDYALETWTEFSFANEAFIENKKKWPTEFVEKSKEWSPVDGPKISATTFGDTSGAMNGQLDAVLYVRAMHNLSRFQAEGQYMTQALKMTHDVLKPGGVVGVVQHRAPADATDEWAIGSAGYLKQANVIAAFEAAGFEFVKSSEINANPKDMPSGDDVVWRLPPSLRGAGDDKALEAERAAIGESDRMTLLFKKI
jgi:predicted methyltransferase